MNVRVTPDQTLATVWPKVSRLAGDYANAREVAALGVGGATIILAERAGTLLRRAQKLNPDAAYRTEPKGEALIVERTA